MVKVRAQLKESTKTQLEDFLKNNIDMMAHNVDEMPRVDPSTKIHHLNVRAKCEPIKQKKRTFALEWQEAIKEEIQQLTQAGFICEVMYLKWLAKMVLVKKTNRK